MKRILSFVLSVVFIIGILPCMGVAAEEEAMTATERVIAQMRDIGIMQGDENGDIEPAATLSRAEFVTLIARIMGIEHYYDQTENDLFVDVPQSHWAKSAILACAKAGYVIGTDDGIFSPEDNVSLEQAAKIMIKVLGYEYLAQEKGGYPAGHIYAANRLELLDNIATPQTEPITKGDAAHLFFNSLEVPLTEEVGYSGESVLFSSMKERTILAQYLKLDREEAVLEAVYGLSLNGEEVEEQNQIMIGGKLYEYDGADLRSLVGRTVDYFYTIDEKQTKSTVKSILPAENMNREVTIQLKKLNAVKENIINYEDEKGNEAEVKVSPKLKYVYNYELLMDYDIKELETIKSGEITLIDNNEDKVFDVAFLYDYKTYIVETKTDASIQGKFKDEVDVIDLKKDKRIIYLNYHDGRVVQLSKIRTGHIISVIQTDKILEIRINDTNVSGIYESSNDDTITVNGVEYEKAKDMYAPNVKMGEMVSIYLNAFGQVAYIDGISVSTLQTGYLIQLAESDLVFSGNELKVKIFTEEGEMKIFTIAERMTMKDDFYDLRKDKDKVLANLSYTAERNIKPQLVKYALNSEGKICQIVLAANYLNADEDGFVLGYGQDVVNESTGKVTQGVTIQNASGYGIIDTSDATIAETNTQSTIVFLVPTWDAIVANSVDDDAYAVMPLGSMQNETEAKGSIYYNSKTNAIADYVVMYSSNPLKKYNSSYNRPVGIFLDKVTVWQDGEAKTAVEYFNGTSNVSVAVADYYMQSNIDKKADDIKDGKLTAEEAELPTVKKGDTIRLSFNWKGEIDLIERVYIEETGELGIASFLDKSYGIGSGYIVYDKDDYVRISPDTKVIKDSSVLALPIFSASASTVIVVEKVDGEFKVSKGGREDIVLGSKVFYIKRSTSMRTYIVYK